MMMDGSDGGDIGNSSLLPLPLSILTSSTQLIHLAKTRPFLLFALRDNLYHTEGDYHDTCNNNHHDYPTIESSKSSGTHLHHYLHSRAMVVVIIIIRFG